MTEAVQHWRDLQADLARAAQDAGRLPQDICLVAVSKTFPAAEIEPVLEAGQRVFGENRVQEAMQKWPALKARYQDIELHLIGPLQTNKVKEALALFDVIETVDRPSLAEALAKYWSDLDLKPKLYIQVNIGEEDQKAGVLVKDLPDLIKIMGNLGLPIEGLMCIPPVNDPPSPYFALLHQLAKRHGFTKLSMGMSADYVEAIQLGATHVRIGSALFGHR